MLFREAVSERIYELCDKFKMTPNRLAELSTNLNTNQNICFTRIFKFYFSKQYL